MDDLTPSPAELRTHLLRRLIADTAVPGETATDARFRGALIVQAFQALDPANVLEAMTACHLISLQFVYENALRALSAGAASAEDDGEKAQGRRCAQVNTLSRTLLQWRVRYEADRALREKRDAEEREAAARKTAPMPVPAPAHAALPAPDAKRNGDAAPARAPGRTPPFPAAAAPGGTASGEAPPAPRPAPPPSFPLRANGQAGPAMAAVASPGGG